MVNGTQSGIEKCETVEAVSSCEVSIAIPTYGRDQVLIDTLRSLFRLAFPPGEILVIDQTESHSPEAIQCLWEWHRRKQIRWIRTKPPSITKAMNLALRESCGDRVLFLDDDIRPRAEIVRVHAEAHHRHPELWATVGQVIQPWHQPADLEPMRSRGGLRLDEDFPFHSTRDITVHNVMAGNLCVHRERALAIGGFDENFQGAAYRFETEFARRIELAGGSIRFLGGAGIDHLRVERGGTRTAGSHLTSASPRHGVGDHYYALLHGESPLQAHAYCFRRIFREVRTKFHLTHPWWIPVKLLGEVRAYLAARQLAAAKRGRRATAAKDALTR